MNVLDTVNIYTYVGYFYDEHAGHVVDFYLPESFSISGILKILLTHADWWVDMQNPCIEGAAV